MVLINPLTPQCCPVFEWTWTDATRLLLSSNSLTRYGVVPTNRTCTHLRELSLHPPGISRITIRWLSSSSRSSGVQVRLIWAWSRNNITFSTGTVSRDNSHDFVWSRSLLVPAHERLRTAPVRLRIGSLAIYSLELSAHSCSGKIEKSLVITFW